MIERLVQDEKMMMKIMMAREREREIVINACEWIRNDDDGETSKLDSISS